MDPSDPAYQGQAEYTRFFLSIYDVFVLGFMLRVVWRYPKQPIVARYHKLVGRRHLDVGPGTGYFLEKAALSPDTEITLLDPNADVLEHSARRLASMSHKRWRPTFSSLCRWTVPSTLWRSTA